MLKSVQDDLITTNIRLIIHNPGEEQKNILTVSSLIIRTRRKPPVKQGKVVRYFNIKESPIRKHRNEVLSSSRAILWRRRRRLHVRVLRSQR